MEATISAPRGPCRSAAAAASALIGAATCLGEAAAEEWFSIEGSDIGSLVILDAETSATLTSTRLAKWPSPQARVTALAYSPGITPWGATLRQQV